MYIVASGAVVGRASVALLMDVGRGISSFAFILELRVTGLVSGLVALRRSEIASYGRGGGGKKMPEWRGWRPLVLGGLPLGIEE